LSSVMVGIIAFSTSCSPSPLRHCLSSGFRRVASCGLQWGFRSTFFNCPSSATRPPSSAILASNLDFTASIFSNDGRKGWDSSVFWSCRTCSRRERFSARRREQSFSRLRIRIDCCELVLSRVSSTIPTRIGSVHVLCQLAILPQESPFDCMFRQRMPSLVSSHLLTSINRLRRRLRRYRRLVQTRHMRRIGMSRLSMIVVMLKA
jgi:hypothetical protein